SAPGCRRPPRHRPGAGPTPRHPGPLRWGPRRPCVRRGPWPNATSGASSSRRADPFFRTGNTDVVGGIAGNEGEQAVTLLREGGPVRTAGRPERLHGEDGSVLGPGDPPGGSEAPVEEDRAQPAPVAGGQR